MNRRERRARGIKKERRVVKIAVVVPTHDMTPAMFAFDLASMFVYSTGTLVAEGLANLALMVKPGTYIHVAREALAEEAILGEFDYILWLDSDMRFPRDTLVRLLAHDKAIVGANYVTRSLPPVPTAIKKVGNPAEGGQLLLTTEEHTGLEEVEACGFGCLLMKTSVFRNMLDDRPWFFYEWDDEQHVGEDVFFCRKARNHDWRIYVDHDLSKEIAHIGHFEYQTSQLARLMDEAEEQEPEEIGVS